MLNHICATSTSRVTHVRDFWICQRLPACQRGYLVKRKTANETIAQQHKYDKLHNISGTRDHVR